MRKRLGFAAVLALAAGGAGAFTQSGGGIGVGGSAVPMGHEWLTVQSALELLNDRKISSTDPRTSLAIGKGLAQETNLSTASAIVKEVRDGAHKVGDAAYSSGYLAVYSAVMGERWVDLAGMNVAKGKLSLINYDCFDAAVQEPDSNMYDHFMRRWSDHGNEGALKAIEGSKARFLKHFINAALADAGKIKAYDGGAASNEVEVERRFFLFGRALHLLQDSFSSEHTVRDAQDHFMAVRQIKGYLCARGADHHSFATPTAKNYNGNGDVIWNEDVSNFGKYTAANMKPVARAALEATKEAWAAFFRVLAEGDKAKRRNLAMFEAKRVAGLWMQYSPDDVKKWYAVEKHQGKTFTKGGSYLPENNDDEYAKCVEIMEGKFGKTGKTTAKEKMAAIQKTLLDHQAACLANIQVKDNNRLDFDANLHIPFYWEWKTTFQWLPTPKGWEPVCNNDGCRPSEHLPTAGTKK